MSTGDALALILLLAGSGFYFAGTVGLLRFPDVFCRLHALTKADNLGLCLICAGLAVLSQDWRVASVLFLIWLGLLRFPDVFCRLHALTKADNLGLCLICAGLAVLSQDWRVASVLFLIWLVGLLAATVSAHLIARHARQAGSRDQEPRDPA